MLTLSVENTSTGQFFLMPGDESNLPSTLVAWQVQEVPSSIIVNPNNRANGSYGIIQVQARDVPSSLAITDFGLRSALVVGAVNQTSAVFLGIGVDAAAVQSTLRVVGASLSSSLRIRARGRADGIFDLQRSGESNLSSTLVTLRSSQLPAALSIRPNNALHSAYQVIQVDAAELPSAIQVMAFGLPSQLTVALSNQAVGEYQVIQVGEATLSAGLSVVNGFLSSALKVAANNRFDGVYRVQPVQEADLNGQLSVLRADNLPSRLDIPPNNALRTRFQMIHSEEVGLGGSISVVACGLPSSLKVLPQNVLPGRYGIWQVGEWNLLSGIQVVNGSLPASIQIQSRNGLTAAFHLQTLRPDTADVHASLSICCRSDMSSTVQVTPINTLAAQYAIQFIGESVLESSLDITSFGLPSMLLIPYGNRMTTRYRVWGVQEYDVKATIEILSAGVPSTLTVQANNRFAGSFFLRKAFDSDLAGSLTITATSDLPASLTIYPANRVTGRYSLAMYGEDDLASTLHVTSAVLSGQIQIRGGNRIHGKYFVWGDDVAELSATLDISMAEKLTGQLQVRTQNQAPGVYEVLEPPSTTTTIRSKIEDAFVRSGIATLNYGTENDMWVGTHGSEEFRSLIKFNDLTAIPQNVTVLKATLRLYINQVNSQPQRIAVHRLLGTWREADVNWLATPPCESQPCTVADTSMLGADSYLDLEISEAFRAWQEGSAGNFGIVLKADDLSQQGLTEFNTHEAYEHRPTLLVKWSDKVIWSAGIASIGGRLTVMSRLKSSSLSSALYVKSFNNAAKVDAKLTVVHHDSVLACRIAVQYKGETYLRSALEVMPYIRDLASTVTVKRTGRDDQLRGRLSVEPHAVALPAVLDVYACRDLRNGSLTVVPVLSQLAGKIHVYRKQDLLSYLTVKAAASVAGSISVLQKSELPGRIEVWTPEHNFMSSIAILSREKRNLMISTLQVDSHHVGIDISSRLGVISQSRQPLYGRTGMESSLQIGLQQKLAAAITVDSTNCETSVRSVLVVPDGLGARGLTSKIAVDSRWRGDDLAGQMAIRSLATGRDFTGYLQVSRLPKPRPLPLDLESAVEICLHAELVGSLDIDSPNRASDLPSSLGVEGARTEVLASALEVSPVSDLAGELTVFSLADRCDLGGKIAIRGDGEADLGRGRIIVGSRSELSATLGVSKFRNLPSRIQITNSKLNGKLIIPWQGSSSLTGTIQPRVKQIHELFGEIRIESLDDGYAFIM